ncbi:MAG: electron transfer flavoprotein subunit alpha [Firmicutes bacterium]|nr:electron transfer flavoprotein subunit alpha [Bacillota bacterium]
MGSILVDGSKCNLCGKCVDQCPFGAIQIDLGKVIIDNGCRLCKLCIKNCPEGAISLLKTQKTVDKNEWNGVLVYVEHLEGEIHPVTLELIGKARQLAGEINHPVYALIMGTDVIDLGKGLLEYGVDRVLAYQDEALRHFRADLYTNIFEDCIKEFKPSIVLVGATSVGRSLAPRVAARFRTGLTADCTQLEVRPNTDLVQIRPAFGGNIMAQIVTVRTRPQFATVRYKVMEKADRLRKPGGEIIRCQVKPERLQSGLKVIRTALREKQENISDAEVLVVAGRGVKNPADLGMINELAELLNGQLACTRPLVEAGWLPYTKQIGLSGRTVKPKLIITCGVSGAIQFTACMSAAEQIFAINKDRNAPIFKVAHYGIVGDIYQIIPALIAKLKKEVRSV